jgi:hypothetical protein
MNVVVSPALIEWSNVLLGAGISAAFAIAIGGVWVRGTGVVGGWFLERRGEIRGTWYEILAPCDDKPERIDIVKLHQRGQRIHGHIERLRPEKTGSNAKWRFAGYVHGNVVVCVFFTTTPKNDPSSYGVINMHRDPAHPDALYRGYYTRPDFAPYEEFVGEGISRRPISWQREHPDTCRYR